MPSLSKFTQLALLGSLASVSAFPRVMRPRMIEVRQASSAAAVAATATSEATTATSAAAVASTPQSPAAAASAAASASGLTDIDILQFALTLEHLESTFYSQGFSKFADSDFTAAGLTADQITGLKATGQTEATHVTVLSQVLTSLNSTPVQACNYNFGFTDAAGMLATARVLEAVGVSAYIGAAPLVVDRTILSSAAEIVTVEARHQTFIRTLGKDVPVPNAFDSALGPRAVFTLAAQFITGCPNGSDLQIPAFPAIDLAGGAGNINAGQSLVLANPGQPAGAAFCAFVNLGSTQYAAFNQGACQVPANLTGEVYMLVTKSKAITDTEILAGPAVIEMS